MDFLKAARAAVAAAVEFDEALTALGTVLPPHEAERGDLALTAYAMSEREGRTAAEILEELYREIVSGIPFEETRLGYVFNIIKGEHREKNTISDVPGMRVRP